MSDLDDIKKDVSINLADLDNAMIEHPSLFVHYAMKTVVARKGYDSLKNVCEIRTAQLSAKHRTAFVADGVKPTEALIDAAVKTDPVYVKAVTELVEAQAKWRMCEVAESAFIQRKDLILELARDRRKEREGQLRVLEQSAAKNAVLEGMKELNKKQ